jgi:hypothetical protein
MSRGREIGIFAFVALGAAAVGAGITFFVAHKNQAEVAVAESRGELLSLRAPPGTVCRWRGSVTASMVPKNNCGDRRVYDARVADEAGSARVYRIQTGQRRGALTER